MSHRVFGSALALALSLGLAYPAAAQEPDPTVMAAYAKAMTPGEHHAKLAELAGDWELTVTSWMAPETEPIVTTATCNRKMIMGGRYMVESVEGTAMGQPFNGHGMSGYNNVEEQYEAVWIDNMGTGIYTSYGNWDEEANALVMHGSYVDPVTGKKKKIKTFTRTEGPDKEIFEWYEKLEGEEEGRKTMEIVYVRK